MTGDLIALGCGIASGISAGLMYIAVNWERLHANAQRAKRRGLVMVSETGRRVEVEGGWRDVWLLTLILSAVVLVVVGAFVGCFLVGRWIWGAV